MFVNSAIVPRELPADDGSTLPDVYLVPPPPSERKMFTRGSDRIGGKHYRVRMRRDLAAMTRGLLREDPEARIAVVATSDFLRRRYGIPNSWNSEFGRRFDQESGWEDARQCAARALKMAAGFAPDAEEKQLRVEHVQGLEGRNDLKDVTALVIVGAAFGRRPYGSEPGLWGELAINVLIQAVGRLRLQLRSPNSRTAIIGWGAPLTDPRVERVLNRPNYRTYDSVEALLRKFGEPAPKSGRGASPESRLIPVLIPEAGSTIAQLAGRIHSALEMDPVPMYSRLVGVEGFSGYEFEDGMLESVRYDLGLGVYGEPSSRSSYERLVRHAESVSERPRIEAIRGRLRGYLKKQAYEYREIPAAWSVNPAVLRRVQERAMRRWLDLVPDCARVLLVELLAACRSRDSRRIRRMLRNAGFAETETGAWKRTMPFSPST